MRSEALGDPDPGVAATAIQIAARVAAPALLARLPALPPTQQVIALPALAAAGVRDAAPVATALLASPDAGVAEAAVRALGEIGDARSVAALTRAVAARPETGDSATAALSMLHAEGVDAAILEQIAQAGAGPLVCLVQAAEARQLPGLTEVLLTQSRHADATVRAAALKALGRQSAPAVYPALINLLAAQPEPAVEAAVGAAGKRLPEGASRTAPLLALLQRDDVSPATQVAALRLLAAAGGAEPLQAVRTRLEASDATIADGAFRALCAWSEPGALPLLAAQAESATNETRRVLALRGLLRLSAGQPDQPAWLARMRPLVRSADDKRGFIGALAESASLGTLEFAVSYTNDPEVRAEAQAAVQRITEALPPGTARRTAIAAGLPPGTALRGYLDAGAERANDEADPVRIRAIRGADYSWPGSGSSAQRAAASILFDGKHVDIEVTGLDPARRYTLGFSWWDGDGKGRTMSVQADDARVVTPRVLPKGPAAAPGAESIQQLLPKATHADGTVRLTFTLDAGENAVVSEVWIIEGEAAQQMPAGSQGPAAAEVRANAGASTKVLIVTGHDYPGHLWRETTPVLTAHLAQDPRLEISVTEDARFLGAPTLTNYACIVLHYMNWQDPGPGAAAQENLRRTLEAGTGLVLVHFACGAFQGWPEFVKMAGRVWDPKLRGHDPYGLFTVRIVDATHPVTKGLRDFTTTDELYTCLAGDTPVHLLCDAVSKVDQKPYPMAFVLEYGKGRVFLSTLGHDVKAFNDAAGQLYRRATAWAAGVPRAN
jgi:type 1 glutamine amidotransferase/HEAT repeat protein